MSLLLTRIICVPIGWNFYHLSELGFIGLVYLHDFFIICKGEEFLMGPR